MLLPDQILVEAHLESHRLADESAEVHARMEAALSDVVWTGRRVGLAVGSRGIDRQAAVVAAVVRFIADRGGRPFIIPAMGSHGGATGAGQAQVLESLGVTEEAVGAPIRSSLETVDLGVTPGGTRGLTARDAREADAIILINRVKPHTDFDGRIGSGLLKLCAIGLGKPDGAFECHRAAARAGHEAVIRSVARLVLARLPVVCGVALLEDGRHQLARIEVLRPAELESREEALLEQAKRWAPSLPFPVIDVLIIDEMGKDISGAGMDPHVTGRGVDGLPRGDRSADVRAIYVRALTPETHGNAIGLGLADVVSSALVAGMNRRTTYTNALSAMVPATARIPMHFDTDAECLQAALRVAGADEPSNAGIVRIRNTLALDRFVVSRRYAREVSERADLRALTPATPWRLGPDGNLESVDWLVMERGAER